MATSETLNIIKESFESWYNRHISPSKVSIAINYRDEQKLSIKAYHTITMEMQALGIKDGKAYSMPLITLQENYNHGVTSEEEAKEGLTKKLLDKLYGFPV